MMAEQSQKVWNIELVLFDFGGVIAEEGFKKGLAAIAKTNGLDASPFIRAAFEATYSTGYVLGKAPESAFWGALRQKTGVKGDDDSFRSEVVSRFVLRDWMMDLVQALKAEGIKVGILSDQTDILDKLDQKYDFFRKFDYIFNSYYMGKGKRDSSLFRDVIKIVKVEPDRVLFVDDDPENVARARHEGWNVIHYADRESFCKAMNHIVSLH